MSTKKVIEKKQSYLMETIHYTDGSSVMNRLNKGYSVVELLGLTTIIQADLLDVYKQHITQTLPKQINRKSSNSPMIHKGEVPK